jgi:hypothetical protein
MAKLDHTTPTPIARRRCGVKSPATTGDIDNNASGIARETHFKKMSADERKRNDRAQTGNVVTLPKRPTGTEAIIAGVAARSKAQSDELCRMLDEVTAVLKARQREEANELIIIGMKMHRPMMDDFIEIGRRMLAGRA